MKRAIGRLSSALVIFFLLSTGAEPVYAQDAGGPVMRNATFYILGGTAAGAGLGIVYFMLDPLNPNADFKGNVLTGAAIGALAGMVSSVMMLSRQVVVPETVPYSEDEFEQEVQGSLLNRPLGSPAGFLRSNSAMAFSESAGFGRDPQPAIPLVGFAYSF